LFTFVWKVFRKYNVGTLAERHLDIIAKYNSGLTHCVRLCQCQCRHQWFINQNYICFLVTHNPDINLYTYHVVKQTEWKKTHKTTNFDEEYVFDWRVRDIINTQRIKQRILSEYLYCLCSADGRKYICSEI